MKTNENVVEKSIVDMVVASTQYCTFIEQIDSFDESQIVEYLLKMCPLLYLKGNMLPLIECEDNAAYEQYVTEEQYEVVLLSIRKKIEKIDYFQYYEQSSSEVVTVSMSEFLADIYQDLKDMILLYGKGLHESQKAAISLGIEHFEQNWGRKLSVLLPYLHHLTFPQMEENDEMYW